MYKNFSLDLLPKSAGVSPHFSYCWCFRFSPFPSTRKGCRKPIVFLLGNFTKPTSTVVNWHRYAGFLNEPSTTYVESWSSCCKPMVFTPQSCRMIDDWKTIETLALVNTPGPWMVWIPQPSLKSTQRTMVAYVWLLRVCLGWLSTRAKAAVWESPCLWRFGHIPITWTTGKDTRRGASNKR